MTDRIFAQRLKAIIDTRDDITEAGLAVSAGLSNSVIRKLIKGDTQNPRVDTAMLICEALGTSLEDFLNGVIEPTVKKSLPVVGKVGAGAQVPVFEAYDHHADAPQVEAPKHLPSGDMVAVEVQGDSMEPIYTEGDLLFYTRVAHDGVPIDAIGKKCVCEDESGMGWVKLVKKGTEPDKFHLIALNPDAENQHDVKLKWASPVRLHWPKEFVKKV